jgi:hypothetical protein
LKQKHNVKVKVKCAIWNKQIDGLAINNSFAPLIEQGQMWALEVEEMEPSSKIDLKDVLKWKSIKDACRFGALIITKFSKKGCISLVAGKKLSQAT